MLHRSVAGNLEGPLQGLTTLQSLNMSVNALSGTLPNDWLFPELKVLNLSDNQIFGVVPTGAHPLLLPHHHRLGASMIRKHHTKTWPK